MSNKKFMTKGLLLTIIGFIVAFLPKIITYTLYGICIIIALFCVFEIIQGITSGDFGIIVPSVIGTALLIAAIIFLPKIVAFGIAFIGGIIIAVMGISEIVRALKTKNSIFGSIIGAIMLVVGCLCIFNPFGAGKIARILVGIVILLNGLLNLLVAHTITSRNKNSSSVIDVTGFTIDDK